MCLFKLQTHSGLTHPCEQRLWYTNQAPTSQSPQGLALSCLAQRGISVCTDNGASPPSKYKVTFGQSKHPLSHSLSHSHTYPLTLCPDGYLLLKRFWAGVDLHLLHALHVNRGWWGVPSIAVFGHKLLPVWAGQQGQRGRCALQLMTVAGWGPHCLTGTGTF